MSVEWRKWRQWFKIYLSASGQNSKSPEVKISLLLHALRTEGIEIYNTFTLTDEEQKDFAVVLSRFQERFVPKQNITYQQYCFFSRSQASGESIDQYVTELRTCEFDTLNSLILDRLVCRVTDIRMTERLLRQHDLTLDKAIDICCAAESSHDQIFAMEATADRQVDMFQSRHQVMQASSSRRDNQHLKTPLEPCSRCS